MPTCEEEQTDPRSVNGCLGDVLKGRERSCLWLFALQQPPPRNVTLSIWRRMEGESAWPQKKRPEHTGCRPSTGPTGHCYRPSPQTGRPFSATVFLFNISVWLEDVLFTTPGHVQWLTQEETEHNMSAGEPRSWGHHWGNTQSRTKNVFIPQMHQLSNDLGLNNGQLSCDWLMDMWEEPRDLCCLWLHLRRDGWCRCFLPPPAYLKTICREAFLHHDSV